MVSNFGQLLLICPAGMDFSDSFPHFKLNNMNWAGFQHLSENEKKERKFFLSAASEQECTENGHPSFVS